MSSCGSNAGIETTAPLVNSIANSCSTPTHTHTNQMPPQIVHILLFSGRLAAPDFVTKCTEVRALR